MGEDFDMLLCFPRSEVWNVMGSLAELGREDRLPGIEIIIDNKEKLHLPFDRLYEEGPIKYDSKSTDEIEFSTSIRVEVDEVVRDYWEIPSEDTNASDKDKEAPQAVHIGYFHMTVKFGRQHVIFKFRAATYNIASIMHESRSMRQVFLGLLRKHNGIFMIYHPEYGEGTVLWFDGEELNELVPNDVTYVSPDESIQLLRTYREPGWGWNWVRKRYGPQVVYKLGLRKNIQLYRLVDSITRNPEQVEKSGEIEDRSRSFGDTRVILRYSGKHLLAALPCAENIPESLFFTKMFEGWNRILGPGNIIHTGVAHLRHEIGCPIRCLIPAYPKIHDSIKPDTRINLAIEIFPINIKYSNSRDSGVYQEYFPPDANRMRLTGQYIDTGKDRVKVRLRPPSYDFSLVNDFFMKRPRDKKIENRRFVKIEGWLYGYIQP